jgi:hypothetical protein
LKSTPQNFVFSNCRNCTWNVICLLLLSLSNERNKTSQWIPCRHDKSRPYLRAEETAFRSVRVRVMLRPTISRSVSLGVEPRLGLMTRCYVLLDSYSFVSLAPSLTRGRVCHLSLSLSVYSKSSIDKICTITISK